MPVVDYEARITGRFDCPTPASASPGEKHRYKLPAIYDTRRPHCAIDLVLGTRGVQSERTDCSLYTGHVPDSPCMLGPEATGIYARGLAATGMSGKRFVAMAAAAALGATIAASGVSAAMGVIALIHYLHGSWLVAFTGADYVFGMACFGAAGACMATLCDWGDWSAANRRFSVLHQMAVAASRLERNERRPHDATDTDGFVRNGLASHDWAIQQASLELEALRVKKGLAPPPDGGLEADRRAAQAAYDKESAPQNRP